MSMKIKIPPIKSQGIKTKLVPWIGSMIPEEFQGRWIEPFLGTGVVAFNLAPEKALLCDANPHIVNFYSAIADEVLTPERVRDFLCKEGCELEKKGEDHYYFVRDRFNTTHSPLDFLFLNRAGFNGMIRFNKKGGFNVPFCRNQRRFERPYVTKIVNQVAYLFNLFKAKDFSFCCQGFEKTLQHAADDDIVYCDPPYIDRSSDYYNSWDEDSERRLFDLLSSLPTKFILSTWHHNDFRENRYIKNFWGKFNIMTRDHFYHVGGGVENRNSMVEALVMNYVSEENSDQTQHDIQYKDLQTELDGFSSFAAEKSSRTTHLTSNH